MVVEVIPELRLKSLGRLLNLLKSEMFPVVCLSGGILLKVGELVGCLLMTYR